MPGVTVSTADDALQLFATPNAALVIVGSSFDPYTAYQDLQGFGEKSLGLCHFPASRKRTIDGSCAVSRQFYTGESVASETCDLAPAATDVARVQRW